MKSTHVRSSSPLPNPRAPLAKLSAQSCSGISFKSQALYMIVYATRYLGQQLSHPRVAAEKLIQLDRYLLDLHLRLALQHDIQASFPWLAGVHHIPNAKRLQANARSKHRYIAGAIPAWWKCAPRSPLSLSLRDHGGQGPYIISRTVC